MTSELNPANRSSWPRTAGLVLLGLVAGAGGARLLLRAPAHDHDHDHAGPAQKQMYQCPMHPQVIMDHPGTCPICGMELVAMEAAAPVPAPAGAPAPAGLSAVTIDPERQQLIGLTTAPVVLGPVDGELRALGRIAVDETRVGHVHVKVDGYVEKLFVDFVGRAVAKGQPLFTFYSPEFVSAQREYLLAARTQKALADGSLRASGQDLLDASQRRLAMWDVPQAELDELARSGEVRKSLTLVSPISGVVTAKTVSEGNRITPTDTAFEITDLGHVWAVAEIYEQELGRVRLGMPARFTLEAFPGRDFSGRVAFIDPQMDPKTRTVKVRIDLANPKGELKPEMFGEALLSSGARKGLLVPLDAVLDSGTRKVVFLALGDGRFEPREVETGVPQGEQVEIRSGLKAGDKVVTRANFLVDSESRLKAALTDLAGKPATSHQH